MTFEEKLKFLRKMYGLRQVDLAEQVGVSAHTISKWETSQKKPGIDQLRVLSKTFNVTHDQLVNDDITIDWNGVAATSNTRTDYIAENTSTNGPVSNDQTKQKNGFAGTDFITKQILSLVKNVESLDLEQLRNIRSSLQKLENNRLVSSNQRVKELLEASLDIVNNQIFEKEETIRLERIRREEAERIRKEKARIAREKRKAKARDFVKAHENTYVSVNESSGKIVPSKKMVKTGIITFAIMGCGGLAMIALIIGLIGSSVDKGQGSLPAPEIAISESTPMETSPAILMWPDCELAQLIPVPNSKYGMVEQASEEQVLISVEAITPDEFARYVEECALAGFSYIKSQDDCYYEAGDYSERRLSLSLSDDDCMTILIQEPIYSVDISVDCLSNLLFSRYDIGVYFEGEELGVITHGGEGAYQLELNGGSYILEVRKNGYSEPIGRETLTVSESCAFGFEASCHSDSVSLTQIAYESGKPLLDGEVRIPHSATEYKYDNIDTVITSLKNAGFTNIITTIVYDLSEYRSNDHYVESITVAGNTDFAKGSAFSKDAEILITYHMPESEDPSRIKVDKNASDYKGMHYLEVETMLRSLGFTTIFVKEQETQIESYDEGEVYYVTINSKRFEAGDSFKPEDRVDIVYYHYVAPETIPVVPNITIDNNSDFAALMRITDQTDAVTIRKFANAHIGDIIEFDGCVVLMMQHKSYTTRFDVCLAGGDYSGTLYGPLFAFENVNFYEMQVSGTDTVAEGMLFRIEAKIKGFNSEGNYIVLEPVAMTAR